MTVNSHNGHRRAMATKATSPRSANKKPPTSNFTTDGLRNDLHPPKLNIRKQPHSPRTSKHSLWIHDLEQAGGSTRRSAQSNSLVEGYESSNDSFQPSYPISNTSSIGYPTADTPATRPSSLANSEFIKPAVSPERDLAASRLVNIDSRTSSTPHRPSEDGTGDESGVRTPTQHDVASSSRAHRDHLHSAIDVEEASSPAPAVDATSGKPKIVEKDVRRGKHKITAQKYAATFFLVAANTMFIFASWWWARYYYIYLPFISFPLVLNCCMIASITCFKLRNTIRPEKIIEPEHIENLAMVMPCYNETLEECTKSLDSLVYQVGIEEHKKGIMVICDGRVRGPGMEKTTAEYLLEDILIDQSHREKIKRAYKGWNGQHMDIEVAMGSYKGVPFYLIVKEENQGKRDSLIVIRSFLFKYNIRHANPAYIFSRQFFYSMSRWLERDVEVDTIDHLIGMDADTIFDRDCISQLLKESKYPNTVGVCGYVAVDFSGGNWNVWSLYQNAEYTIAQGLRRLHQSIATKKVSCLPGCCQLLKICEYTCGDKVLIELFGYHPMPRDGMIKQIRATASEDRNHVCLMLTTFPMAQTRQALRARAFTDVPHSWSVFLSQRRRWTLGATSNDLLLFVSRHCQWWERILAFSNVMVWCLNVFIVASIGCMIVAFMTQPWWIIMAFAGVMIIPLAYYIIIATWLPRTMRERLQYLLGLFIFVVGGPFLNITIMVFAVLNMDSFGWGKTRLVIPDDVKNDPSEKRLHDNQDSGAQNTSHTSSSGETPFNDEATVGTEIQSPRSVYTAQKSRLATS